ncbi:MAG: molybdenum cofactor biosynthesis protein MoaA [Frankiales bacterium]|jgi:cyclic pyranopterin phosphate synthase|nr:molybdenum cofactor biosynthesis protein MoaA [Frankiales bacterium]
MTAALLDTFGRAATDLRVSLTDKCNLRCTYCMPAEGLPWLPSDELLSDDELVRLVSVAASLGVRTVRLTGGEPLIRPGLPGLVARLAELVDLSLTTNGLGLTRLAQPLRDAGLRRVNVSLDTLRPDRFLALTRRDRLADVLAGLAAAKAAGLEPVKVNTVLMRDVNDDEAGELLDWSLAHGYELRFIEQMPLDPQHSWDRGQMVTAEEVLERLSARHTLTVDPSRGSAPAEVWLVDGGPARVGVVGSVTRPFCGTCDRIRLTADGQLRTCLFARDEFDLRTALRAGETDEELAARMSSAVLGKKAGHGIDDPSFLQPDRPMSAIGG